MANTSAAPSARATDLVESAAVARHKLANKLAAFDAYERAELQPLEAAIDAAAAALEKSEYLKRRRELEQARLAHSSAAARLESDRLQLRADLAASLPVKMRERLERLRRHIIRSFDSLRLAPNPEPVVLVTPTQRGEMVRDRDPEKVQAENDRLCGIWEARAARMRDLGALIPQIDEVPYSANPGACLSAIAEQLGKLSSPIEE